MWLVHDNCTYEDGILPYREAINYYDIFDTIYLNRNSNNRHSVPAAYAKYVAAAG